MIPKEAFEKLKGKRVKDIFDNTGIVCGYNRESYCLVVACDEPTGWHTWTSNEVSLPYYNHSNGYDYARIDAEVIE